MSGNKSKKILIIRFGAIGDVVHSSIIQKAIKEKDSDVQIDFMTSKDIMPVISRDKNLSKLWCFDMKRKNDYFYIFELGLQIRKEKYDYVFNMQNGLRNIWLSIHSGAKSFKHTKCKTHATDKFFQPVTRVYSDIEKPKSLKIYLDENKLADIKSRLEQYPRPYFMIAPAGDHDRYRKGRVWPFENWNKLGRLLREKFGGTVIVVGSRSEKQVHEKFVDIEGAKIFTGELSLDESVHLFSLADIFISGDSGPLHIASALDVYTIGLYGSTSPIIFAPYGEKGHTINSKNECKNCFKKTCKYLKEGENYTPCMKSITPENVLNYISEVLYNPDNLFSPEMLTYH